DRCMTSPELDGGHVEHQLGVYVLGELSPDEASTVAEHLATCGRCSVEAAGLADVRGVLDHLDSESVARLLRDTDHSAPPAAARPDRGPAAGRPPAGPGRPRPRHVS